METAPLNLLDLNKKIKTVIKDSLASYWVTAEISELKVNYSGHCYLEFIQKDDKTDRVIARSRATIWSNVFRMIKPYFETTTGTELTEGITVMVRVVAEFHEVYGLSLNILDIEPTYTVGEIAVRKQKVIEKLKKEGVFEMNKEIDLPYLTRKIAVISSKTAAGYEDFVNQLSDNPHGYKYYIKLFPAAMQGNDAENSIINQLERIFTYARHFDAVCIIRGGGAQADLDCFNNYWLAYHIAQYPLPVLTGIGHEQDESVADMVANTRLKTPTAVAEFLIDRMSWIEEDLITIQNQIVDSSRLILSESKNNLLRSGFSLQTKTKQRINKENKLLTRMQSTYVSTTKKGLFQNRRKILRLNDKLQADTNTFLLKHKNRVENLKKDIKTGIKIDISLQKHTIEMYEQSIRLNNPDNILKKGYSITMFNKEVIKDASKLSSGEEIETRFYKGKKKSIVK
ncbi:MAG: exodeoxyribonuclease VII large subunit [Bacteroidales bacterium]|nr:exodeoxyribonuclease VII large subunit [Bacteroidales bacterium]MBN2817668.1 exodeoxyribonuclease VII large subunit [Bacteroidales bacterium]